MLILEGDCLEVLKTLESESLDCCVTSPPYWGLRDYGVLGQLGLEKTPEDYVVSLVKVFEEVRRVLKSNGTLWLNMGDTYYGGGNNRGNTKELSNKQKSNRGATGIDFKGAITKHSTLKPKDLVGIPWRVAFALQSNGWYLRQDIIWHKPNPMPESVRDRCTKSHEYIFLLSKNKEYFFDNDAIKEPMKSSSIQRQASSWGGNAQRGMPKGFSPNSMSHYGKPSSGFKNKRSVWTVTTKSFKDAHFATFPSDLIEPCILAGCPKGGVVLDPFFGAGTTGLVSAKNKRRFIGIELNPEYVEIAKKRINNEQFQLEV